MVEIQSCSSLVNASALCPTEHEEKGESVNVIAEISADLRREKQKNAELMERISILEAQIHERDKEPLLSHGQASCQDTRESKSKRQKLAPNTEQIVDEDMRVSSKMKHNIRCIPANNMNIKNCLVTWMCVEDTESFQSETLKESKCAAEMEDTDDSNDQDDEEVGENDICADHEGRENRKDVNCTKEVKEQSLSWNFHEEEDSHRLASSFGGHNESKLTHVSQEINEYKAEKSSNLGIDPVDNTMKCVKHQRKKRNMTGGCEDGSKAYTLPLAIKRDENVVSQKKHRKIAFCPKEVKKIIESEELLLTNAHSHTIRKIIVFASLGIRHGCEDIYELDFNHFSILRKGEPYLSPEDTGEHVLYENPGVRRKIFYPNRQNPTLCPVQILEEEKAMRPSDANCPTSLFLCIKYGGPTRNIPQNEYVRQRMGRNKLKSFGPAICKMAMLVHVRSGSFFFKALGITILFIAGFPDDLVQRETKYRNLDLLQKYYRTDEEAEGDELFLSQRTIDINISPSSQQPMWTLVSRKPKSKRHANLASKNQERAQFVQFAPSNPGFPSQCKPKGNASIQTQAITAVHSITSQAPEDSSVPGHLITSTSSNNLQNYLSSYPILPYPINSFGPMIYWPPPKAYLPYLHPSPQSYRYPIAGNYVSIYPHPFYSNPSFNTIIPKPLKDVWENKNDAAIEDGASESTSSST